MTVDVNTFVGSYPFRAVPHPDPDALLRVLDREGVDSAWVGHLSAPWHRDPGPANQELYGMLQPYKERLRPVPAVRSDWPHWERELARAIASGAPAVRTYPVHWELGGSPLEELAASCAEHGLPLLLTVRFEDQRQRHWLDMAPELPAAEVRRLARRVPGVKVIVCAAGRSFIEEVHWGLTAEERARLRWDISWIWGPPQDDLAHLLRALGADRFLYGSMWPLRLAQSPRANLALLPDDLASLRLPDPGQWH
jgi:predicted TIM-barrel fold metal-dependent hydrolase